MNPWPARWPIGQRAVSQEFALTSGQTFLAGAFVYLTSNAVSECGSDPAAILGIAAEPAADVVRSGYVNVYLGDPNTQFAMAGTTATPAASSIGTSYGIVKSGSEWKVDLTDTSNLRVIVVDIDIPRKLYFCRILDAVRQLPA